MVKVHVWDSPPPTMIAVLQPSILNVELLTEPADRNPALQANSHRVLAKEFT